MVSSGTHLKIEAGNPAPGGALYIYSDRILQKNYSVRILRESLHLVSAVQLVSVKDAPPLNSLRPGAGEDQYPQTFLVLGRLCIVLMEISL